MDQKNSQKVRASAKPDAVSEPASLASGELIADPAITALSFEEAMAQLEQVVGALEAGQLPLAQALAAYQRGAALMRHAQSILAHVQTEIDVIEAGQSKAMDRSALIAQVKE
jgi:exodeoxyribonuclease VII small subunit